MKIHDTVYLKENIVVDSPFIRLEKGTKGTVESIVSNLIYDHESIPMFTYTEESIGVIFPICDNESPLKVKVARENLYTEREYLCLDHDYPLEVATLTNLQFERWVKAKVIANAEFCFSPIMQQPVRQMPALIAFLSDPDQLQRQLELVAKELAQKRTIDEELEPEAFLDLKYWYKVVCHS